MNMPTVFAVYRQGVGRHESAGIFTRKERAIEVATALAAGDVDNWHRYDVVPYVLDEAAQVTPSAAGARWSPDIAEADPVFSIKRKDTQA